MDQGNAFSSLELRQHLSMNRANGLSSLFKQIMLYAVAYQLTAGSRQSLKPPTDRWESEVRIFFLSRRKSEGDQTGLKYETFHYFRVLRNIPAGIAS